MATPRPARTFTSFICHSCRQRLLPLPRRRFSTTPISRADDPPSTDRAIAGLGNLNNTINRRRGFNDAVTASNTNYSEILNRDTASFLNETYDENLRAAEDEKPHRMHIYAHKHNTHITLVQPPKPAGQTRVGGGSKMSAAEAKKNVDTLMSLSTGNIGFRKAGRGTYDAAYQLAAFAMKQMQEKGMTRDIRQLQVILRGFGAGREAVTKALLGTEGRSIRGRISSVVDATRLKQGGPRAKKPRRLG